MTFSKDIMQNVDTFGRGHHCVSQSQASRLHHYHMPTKTKLRYKKLSGRKFYRCIETYLNEMIAVQTALVLLLAILPYILKAFHLQPFKQMLQLR